MDEKISNKTFQLVCNHCCEKIPNISIGLNSYVEVECPHCKNKFFVKTNGKGQIKQSPLKNAKAAS